MLLRRFRLSPYFLPDYELRAYNAATGQQVSRTSTGTRPAPGGKGPQGQGEAGRASYSTSGPLTAKPDVGPPTSHLLCRTMELEAAAADPPRVEKWDLPIDPGSPLYGDNANGLLEKKMVLYQAFWRKIPTIGDADIPHLTHSTFLPTTLAGLPATRVRSGTSLVTMLPAATTAPEPIVTPDKTEAPAPIQTWSPMATGTDTGRGIESILSSWPFPSTMFVFHEIPHSRPMEMCSRQVSVELQWIAE